MPLEEPYRKLVIDYLNLVFGNSDLSNDYWSRHLADMVESKFTGISTATIVRQFKAFQLVRRDEALESSSGSGGLTGTLREGKRRKKTLMAPSSLYSSSSSSSSSSTAASSHESSLLSEQQDLKLCELKRAVFNTWTDDTDGRMALLQRVQAMIGFRFTPKAEIELAQRLRLETNPINRTDLDQIGERIKHMNIVLQVEGILLMIRGFQTRAHDARSAIQYFAMAISKFEEELNSNTNSKVRTVTNESAASTTTSSG